MNDLIKKNIFRLSDLFLFAGIVLGVIICLSGNELMGTINPVFSTIPFPVLLSIFVCFLVSAFLYFLLEYKIYHTKVHILLVFCFLFILFSFVGTVLLSNLQLRQMFGDYNGKQVEVVVSVSENARIIYLMNTIIILTAFFVALFVFPKRIGSPEFLKYANIGIYAIILFLIAYSYFTEYDNYFNFFKLLSSGSINIYEYEWFAPKSIFPHRNIYAIGLELGIVLSLINHSISKNKYHFIFTAVFYINLLITLCKMGILLSSLALLTYLCGNVSFSCTINKKKKIIYLSAIASFVIILLTIAVILTMLNPVLRDKITMLFNRADTISGRIEIWGNAFKMIGIDNLRSGLGYGIYNSYLLGVNIATRSDFTYASHSFIVSIIGRGGIIGLIGFLSIIIITILTFKPIDRKLAFGFIICLLVFILHSLIEDCYYLIVLLLAEMRIYSASSKFSRDKNKNI